MSDPAATDAARAAKAQRRAANRAAREAEALRANLHRRKQQSRAKPATSTTPPTETPDPCR